MVGLDRKQVGEGRTLLVGELGAEAVRAQGSLSLLRGKCPQAAKRLGDHPSPIGGVAAKLLNRVADLLSLLGAEPFHGLGPFNQAAALDRRHIV